MTYMDELHDRGIHYLQTVNFYHRDDPQYREIDYPAAILDALEGQTRLALAEGKTEEEPQPA